MFTIHLMDKKLQNNVPEIEIIGLLGHQGVGKNYIAEKIIPRALPTNKNTLVIAFADQLKINCITKKGVDFDKVFGEKDFETRKMLQIEGTEEGRDKYGKDIWIRTMESWIKVFSSRGIKRFIISDVRFPNEVEWINSVNGIVLKILAPKRYNKRLMNETGGDVNKMNELKLHSSEKYIDDIDIDPIAQIRNDPVDDPFFDLRTVYSAYYNKEYN